MPKLHPDLATLIPHGANATAIARQLNVAPVTILHFMRRHGITPARRGGPRGPRKDYSAIIADIRSNVMTLQEMGDKHGVTRERIRQIAEKFSLERTPIGVVRAEERAARQRAERDARRQRREERRQEKARPFVELREQGLNWSEIGERFGVSAMTAHRLARRVRPDLHLGRCKPFNAEERLRVLIEGRSKGMSWPELAEQLGITASAASQYFYVHAPDRNIAPKKERKMRAPKPIVIRAPRPPRTWEVKAGPWSPEEKSRLKTFWELGMSCSDIGRILHRSKNMVIGEAHRMHLEKRPHVIRGRAA